MSDQRQPWSTPGLADLPGVNSQPPDVTGELLIEQGQQAPDVTAELSSPAIDPQIRNALAQSMPDPDDYYNVLDTVELMARMNGVSPSEILNNWDAHRDVYIGRNITNAEAVGRVRQAWDAGQASVELGRLGTQWMQNPGDTATLAQIQQLLSNMPQMPEYRNLPRFIAESVANLLPQIAAGTNSGILGATGGLMAGVATGALMSAGPGAALAPLTGGVSAGVAAVGTAGLGLAGAGVGFAAGSALENAQIIAGNIFVETMLDEDGQRNAVPIAYGIAASLGGSAISAAIETLQLGSLAAGAQRLLSRATAQAFAKVSAEQATRGIIRRRVEAQLRRSGQNRLIRAGGIYAAEVSQNVAQEIAQESVEYFSTVLAQELSDLTEGTVHQQDLNEYLQLLRQTALQSAAAFSVIGIPASVSNIRTSFDIDAEVEQERQNRASVAEVLRDATGEAFTEQDLRGVSEEGVQTILNAVNEAERNEQVESQEFLDWAGTDVVMDEDMNPQVLYSMPDGRSWTPDENVAIQAAPDTQITYADVQLAIQEAVPSEVLSALNAIADNEGQIMSGDDLVYEDRREAIDAWEAEGNRFGPLRELVQAVSSGQRLDAELEATAAEIGIELGRPIVQAAYVRGQINEDMVVRPGSADDVRPLMRFRALNRAIPRRVDGKIDLQISDDRIDIPGVGTDENIGTIQISRDENEITITSLPSDPAITRLLPEIARSMDGNIKLSDELPNADLARRAIFADQIADLETAIDEEFEKGSPDVAKVEELAQQIEQRLDELMGLSQIAERRAERRAQAQSMRDVFNQAIEEAGSQVSQQQLDAAFTLWESFASRYLGMTAEEFLSRAVAEVKPGDSSLPSDAKGAVQFIEDGKAIIELQQAANITTVIHEMAHVIRRHLKQSDSDFLLRVYRTKTWTVESEERFARDMERYLTTGQVPDGSVRQVFANLAAWFREIYKKARTMFQLNPEVAKRLDKILFNPNGFEQDLPTDTIAEMADPQMKLFQRVSTSVRKGANFEKANPGANDHRDANRNVSLSNVSEPHRQKIVEQIAGSGTENPTPTSHIKEGFGGFRRFADMDSAQALDGIIEQMKSNFRFIWNKIPEEHRNISRHWYAGAFLATQRLAVKHNLSHNTVAAVMAQFSPMTDWYVNFARGERFIRFMQESRDVQESGQIDSWLESKRQEADQKTGDAKKRALAAIENNPLSLYREQYLGKSFNQIVELGLDYDTTISLQAAFLKAVEPSVVGTSRYRRLRPDGRFGSFVRSKDLSQYNKFSWYLNGHLEAAIKTFNAGDDIEAISRNLGPEQHKIRSFYTNIRHPEIWEATTMDTWMMGVATITPAGSSSYEVGKMFSGARDAGTGTYGTYAVVLEATQELAEEFGYQPREVQSILWEYGRQLMLDRKTDANRVAATEIWGSFDRGEISLEEAQEKAYGLYGEPAEPDWLNDQFYEADLEGAEGEPDSSFAAEYRGNDGDRSARLGELRDTKVPARRDGIPDAPRRYFQRDIATEGFQKFKNRSVVKDANGELLQLYHGTLGNITEFDASRGNSESFRGPGHYFSISPVDSGSHYANPSGPDPAVKILDRAHTRVSSMMKSEAFKAAEERGKQDDKFIGGNRFFAEWLREEYFGPERYDGLAERARKRLFFSPVADKDWESAEDVDLSREQIIAQHIIETEMPHEGAMLPVYIGTDKMFVIGKPKPGFEHIPETTIKFVATPNTEFYMDEGMDLGLEGDMLDDYVRQTAIENGDYVFTREPGEMKDLLDAALKNIGKDAFYGLEDLLFELREEGIDSINGSTIWEVLTVNAGTMRGVVETLRDLGYQGTVDYEIADILGNRGWNEDLLDDAVHFTVFPGFESRIKSVYNKGPFSPQTNDLLYSRDSDLARQEWEAGNIDVPTLMKYAHDHQWAADALEELREIDSALQPDMFGMDRAMVDMIRDIPPSEIEPASPMDRARQRISGLGNLSRESINRAFIADAPRLVYRVADALNTKPKLATTFGLAPTVAALGKVPAVGEDSAQQIVRKALTTITKTPDRYRRAFAYIMRDPVEIAVDEELARQNPIKGEAFRAPINQDLELNEYIKAMQAEMSSAQTVARFTAGTLNDRIAKLSEEMKVARKKAKNLESTMARANRGLDSQLENRGVQPEGTISQKIQTLLQNERNRIRQLQREREQALAVKRRMQKLAKHITAKVPNDVDIEYRMQISALQSTIDPRFRSRRTQQRLDKRRAWLEANPDVDIPDSVREMTYKRDLNDYTLEELEALRDEVDALKSVGKLKRQLKLNKIRRRRESTIAEIMGRLGELEDNGEIPTEENQGKARPAQAAAAFIRRPDRLADAIDGRKGSFDGPAHRFFIDQMRDVNNSIKETVRKREAWVLEKMMDLGIEVRDLAKIRYESRGRKFTLDEMLDVYAGIQNDRKRMAIMHGLKISQDEIQGMVRALSENERAFAEVIIAEYDQNYDRLREAHWEHKNQDLGEENKYTPMLRLDMDMSTMDQQLADEVLIREGLSSASPARGFTVGRVNIKAEHQRPIRLGLFQTWSGMVDKQERYIQATAPYRDMRYVLQNPRSPIAQRIKQTYNSAIYDELKDTIARFANPSIFKDHGGEKQLLRQFRKSTALAYLGLNLITVLKQAPSLAFFTIDAGYGNIANAAWQAARGVTDPDGNRVSLYEFVGQRDPGWVDRALDRAIDQFRANSPNKFESFQNRVGQTGMFLIREVDKMVTAIGWKAVYDNARGQGLSEAESVRQARNAVLRTQPAGESIDLPGILAKDNALSILTMFSNQLNQIYQMYTYDMPTSFQSGNWQRGARIALALAVSSSLIWILSNRRLPENPEEVASMIAVDNAMNSVSVVGPMLSQIVKGYSYDVSVLSPIYSAGEASHGWRDMLNGESNPSETEKTIWATYEAISTILGLPYISTKRLYDGVVRSLDGDIAGGIQEAVIGGVIGE